MAFALGKLKLGLAVNALFGYHVGVMAAGLLVHPYKTVQEIVRRRIPSSSIFLPIIIWVIGFISLRFLEHFLFVLLPYLGLWWFIFVWGTSFLVFWQILLVYLFVRFSSSMRL